MKNITILGWFGYGNYGDNLILLNEVNLLREKYPNSNINVYCGNKLELISTFENFENIFFYKRPPIAFYRFYEFLNLFTLINLIKLLIQTDLFILGGGGFFSDRQFFAIGGWLRYVVLFKTFGAQVTGLGMGAGPFYFKYNKILIKYCSIFFDNVLLRDSISIEYFRNTGFNQNKIHRVIDPAFFMPLSKKEIKIKNIGFIIKGHYDYFLEEIKSILDNDNQITIHLIITDLLDLKLNKKLLKSLGNTKRVFIVNESNIFNLTKMISSLEFVFSERLHGSILSFSQDTPFCNIYYHHKGKELISLLGIDKYSVNSNELCNYKLIDFLNLNNKISLHDLDLKKYKDTYLGKI